MHNNKDQNIKEVNEWLRCIVNITNELLLMNTNNIIG